MFDVPLITHDSLLAVQYSAAIVCIEQVEVPFMWVLMAFDSGLLQQHAAHSVYV